MSQIPWSRGDTAKTWATREVAPFMPGPRVTVDHLYVIVEAVDAGATTTKSLVARTGLVEVQIDAGLRVLARNSVLRFDRKARTWGRVDVANG